MTAPRVFKLQSADGLRIAVTDVGAAWMSCLVPAGGRVREVLLGHKAPSDYGVQPGYLGAVVGRYANRIAGASFELDGESFELQANEGPNQLHGGEDGFHRRRWQVTRQAPDALELSLLSPDGDQGFPGELRVRATYRVHPPLTVTLTLEATTTKPTLVNLTGHAYFNLDGDARDIRGHSLRIAARRYLPVGAGMIPTGQQADVTGTPFDFRVQRCIGAALADLQATGTALASHDHCWLLDSASAAEPAATLVSADGSLELALHSNAPGLQFYAGEFLAGVTDRRGCPLAAHAGLALEPQALPDSPHHPEWPQPDAVLRPGEVYRHTLTYRFRPARPPAYGDAGQGPGAAKP